MQSFRRYIANTRGIAAIEMAFIMPFLLFLYFGLVDLTSMISINRKLTYSASVVADLVTQNSNTVTVTNITDYVNAAELIMKPTSIGSVRVEVYMFRKNGGAIENKWVYRTTGGIACGAGTPATTGMDTLMTDGNDLVVARVCYTYSPYVATFLGDKVLGATSFLMSEQIALRPRMSAQLACATCPTS